MLLKIIGLTGGIASGKSTVSGILKRKGAYIIDADIIARDIVKKGRGCLEEIRLHFGDGVLDGDGELNRQRLREIVFNDKNELDVLNSITHPKILEEIQKETKQAINNGEKLVVIDVALLLEMGLEELVDEVWLVDISEKNQLQRLMKRDSIDNKQAQKIINSQMPSTIKRQYADRIIDNNLDVDKTEKQVEDLIQ